MTRHRHGSAIVRVGLLLTLCACSAADPEGPYVPKVCSESLPVNMSVVATKSDDGAMLVTEGGRCGFACECSEDVTSCNWEFSEVPLRPGLYDVAAGEVALTCIYCVPDPENGGGEVGDAARGVLEVVRIDDDGVAGCIVDSDCSTGSRFEASWCP